MAKGLWLVTTTITNPAFAEYVEAWLTVDLSWSLSPFFYSPWEKLKEEKIWDCLLEKKS